MDPNLETSQPKLRQQVLFLLVVTILVYCQSITFPFLNLDDNQYIVGNDYFHHWSSLPSFFIHTGSHLEYKSASFANFYRPVTCTWVLLSYKLFGLHPWLWHLAGLALYLLGVWLLWRVVWHLTGNDFVAIGAGLLYTLHPLHVEGVAWISGASVETLLSVFFLGAFLAYLRWREDRRYMQLAVCGTLTLLALLTKESGVALAPLILVHALIFRQTGSGTMRSRVLAPVISMLVVSGLYITMRTCVVHAVVASGTQHTWGDVFRTAPLLFMTQLWHAFWPTHLGLFYPVQTITQTHAAMFWWPIVGCAAYAAFTVWAVFRKPIVGFLLLWWALALAPSLVGMLTFPDNDQLIQDRFCFVAVAGLCVLLAQALNMLPKAGAPIFGFQPACILFLSVLMGALGALSALQVNTWRTDTSICLHAIEVSPKSERPHMILAAELIKRKDLSGALAEYRDVIRMYPTHGGVYYAYGVTLISSGDVAGAVAALKRAVELSPTMMPPYFVLADLLCKQGRFDEAYKLLQQGIASVHDPSVLRIQLAGIHAAQQQLALSQ